MNKRFVLVIAMVGLMVVATGCGRKCKQAREKIIEPTRTVMNYLGTNPSGAELGQSGCPVILTEFDDILDGAVLIRKIAETRFTDVYSHCTHWVRAVRYRCQRGPHGREQCWPEYYTYCGHWEYDRVRQPGYTEAMDLANDLEIMYDKTSTMCSHAQSGSFDAAYGESRELHSFITGRVKPQSDRVYAMACE